ncbi:MAG TPA: HAMP domain-containing sensor histidine kinase [Caulobacterales bacterium]|nr:HAMP domain-containing sensor histidine kinase [Caulobacterales bacterium]
MSLHVTPLPSPEAAAPFPRPEPEAVEPPAPPPPSAPEAPAPSRALLPKFLTRSLSARVLSVIALFALVGEVGIMVPSLASFHRTWLQERLNAAQIAALALEAAPDQAITESLRHELLENAGVRRVALKRDGTRELRLDAMSAADDMPLVRTVDLRSMDAIGSAVSAIEALFAPAERMLVVLAQPRFESGEFIEIVIPEAPLKRDLRDYAARVSMVSIGAVLIFSWLVYLTLNAVLVRPMRRLTAHIEQFSQSPEDVSRGIRPSGREDEIGRAEAALAVLEGRVRASLRQRARLAGLGGAVAKLAHDLRNSIATAQLVTERLSVSADPQVRQTAPRLERVIARAGGLAEAALRYGRAEEPTPLLRRVGLANVLDEAAADALGPFAGAEWCNDTPAHLTVFADSEHLNRIAANLIRNAGQASANAGKPVRVVARSRVVRDITVVEICDCGPGIPEQARAKLFEPFGASTRKDGAGLGLAIARELANAMGGDVALADSGPGGSIFAITLRNAPRSE